MSRAPARPPRVPPRFLSVPPRARSLGREVVAFARRVGIPLDPSQRLVLDAAMGVDRRGRWASPEVGLMAPRQNGKSSITLARAMWGLFERGEQRILYSTNLWAGLHELFLEAAAIVGASDELAGSGVRVRHSASDLGFSLPGGARLRFVTRSRQAARGAAADCIILDEAGWLSQATHTALVPTLSSRSARANPQVWYAGSAVDQMRHPDGVVFAGVRRRGIGGGDPRLCYVEWSAEVLDEDGNELAPDRVPDLVAADPKVWRRANPAIPARITVSHVEWELRALDRRGFAVERLGVGDWPADDAFDTGPVDVERWNELEDPGSRIVGPIVVAFDVAPDRRSSIAIAGLRDDGMVHVEITDHGLAVPQLVERLVGLVGDYDPWKVATDVFGLAGSVVAQLEEQGVEVHRVSGGEHAEAVGVLLEEVNEGTIRHLGSGELLDAIRGARLRTMGDAALWSRRHAVVDISPLVAASLAVWLARGMPVYDDTPTIW